MCGVCRGMADKRLTPDLLIARIAARQHGVVTASQLLRSGLTRDGVLGRVRAFYHRGRRAMREDNDRDLELELAGFRVVRIEDTRIDEDPAGLAAAVLCLLRAAP